MKVFLIDLNSGEKKELSINNKVEVKDDAAYQIRVEINKFEDDIDISPTISLGDISIPVSETEEINGNTHFKTQSTGSFYDKAIFLNYFGECELSISVGSIVTPYLIDVNITSHKAEIAKDMISYLSNNSEDILQSCYSKSRTGYDYQKGNPNKIVKLKALEDATEQLYKMLPKLRFNRKHDITSTVEFHSSQPPSFSERVNEWLFENVNEIEVANSSNYSFKLNGQFMKVDLPNSVNEIDTDKNENHVIHHFVRVAKKYLTSELAEFRNNFLVKKQSNMEYEGYVKFDNVIRSSLRNVYDNKERLIKGLIIKLELIQHQINKYIPVKKVKKVMPKQTSYSLRHKHYCNSFEAIRVFYLAESGNKEKESFLLGFRSLSQLFEFACLYYLINYMKRFSNPVSINWVYDSDSLIGEKSEKINILGNCFEFQNDNYVYTLLYEKKFYALNKNSLSNQINNLIRVDDGATYYEPDFTIRIQDKSSGHYYFIILDAKFSRRYKMLDKNIGEQIGVLSSIYQKYGNNLKAYTNNGIEELTRFVGVMFGLKTSFDKTNRLTYFDSQFDVDGALPIEPFASADFIDFSDDKNQYYDILDKYIQH